MLDIPAVQNFVVQKAVRMVSEKLETRVSIDRVDIGLFNKIKVQGFYVEDYQRDTLLYVGRLDAFVTSLGILGGGLEFSRGEIVDAKLYLRETPGGEMNIKQIVNRISNPDRKKAGNFQLSLKQATIKNMDLCLERLERRDPEHGIDFSHMHLYGMTAHVADFTIDGSSIYTTIDALTARERSGFVLDRFAGRFYLTSGCLGFEDVEIITEHTNISIPYISLVGNSWADYKEFLGEVRLDGKIRNTTISTDDISYFAPKLRDWHLTVSNLNVELAGEVDDFTGRISSIRIGEGTTFTADAAVKGLPHIDSTYFDLTVPKLVTTGREMEILAGKVAGKKLPANLLQMLDRTGQVELMTRFQGRLSAFGLQADLRSGVGDVSCTLHMRPLKGGMQGIRGNVSTRQFRLGRLLGRTDLFGNLTVAARIDGTMGHGKTDAKVKATLTRFGFNDYVYDSVRLDGRLRNKLFDGSIASRDKNLDFDFAGMLDLNNDSEPRYDFKLDLRHADLARLHVNRRDSVSVLSAHIAANAGGRSLDDLNGRIEVTDVTYKYNDKQVTTKSFVISGENSVQSKLLELHSDFADVTFRSKTSYQKVFGYLRESAMKYLPSLSRKPSEQASGDAQTAVADDFSLLSVQVRNINPVADAITSGLQIADGTSLQLLFNPASDQLSLKANSEYIERRRMLATRLNINASNRGDSLTVYASAEDLYAGALHLPHLSVAGGAKQGKIQLSAGFNDTVNKISALLGVRAEMAGEEGLNGRTVELWVLPSHISRGDKTWQIFAHKILLDTTQVVIDRFFVMNNQQELLINGVASRRLTDSVTLSLRNFDLAPFSQVADQMGYFIEGRTNGTATMKSALRAAEISADILLDSLAVNGIQAPPMQLESRWDSQRNRAGVTLINRSKRDTLIQGFYVPSDVRYYARMKVDSLDMGLLNPVLSGVISDTKGFAKAELTLLGQRREAELKGTIRVSDFSTTVDYTQVAYSMPEAVMEVNNNLFRASNVPVFDPQGNQGRFDIDLNLQHLSNIAYNVRIAPQRMLVLNTTESDNSMFYGKVYATGNARISGDKGFVNMNITATSEDNSTFIMPMSDKSNISRADFVIFKQPETKDSVDLLTQKKMLFERQRKQKTQTASRMNIDLALTVRPDLDFQMAVAGNQIRARGQGALNLQINPRSNIFEMYGDYSITEGSFQLSVQNIINKKFTIESGSTIQWTGSPMDAMLNIEAIYRLKASLQPLLQGTADLGDRSVPVECLIHLRDRLTNPAITFDVRVPGADPETQTVVANALSSPETIDTQFASLLLFSSFAPENNVGSANIGASVSSGLEFLTNQLSRALSADDYNVVLRYRPSSELTNEEVDFGLSKSLINNRLFVEVEGNYIIDNKQAVNSTMSNFMGEAYITYLIDRSGSLKLKAFTQTIDRFDENQGMQETGIGIYYKEDFNNFKDLRQRVKERFTNKKRKAKREARKEEMREEALRVDSIRVTIKK